MGRAERISNFIKAHDSKLFVERDCVGKLCIYRKGVKVEWFDVDGETIGFVRPNHHLVMHLTHNWHALGESVDWGLDVILTRLQQIDLWNRNIVDEIESDYEKRERQTKRNASNKHEDFLREFKRPMAETFKNINTANMTKIDKRRNMEKKLWQF